jgi:Xaa-Pro aminopeptidase
MPVWPDQPEPPRARALPHPIELAGETSRRKRARLAEDLKKRGADAAVLTLPDSVVLAAQHPRRRRAAHAVCAALRDSECGPSVDLFLDAKEELARIAAPSRQRRCACGRRENSRRRWRPQEQDRVSPIRSWAARRSFSGWSRRARKSSRASDPCQLPKACKNEVELAGTAPRPCARRAGAVALPRLVRARGPKGALTEIDTVEKLEAFRDATGALKDVSFDSISGAGPARRYRALPRHAQEPTAASSRDNCS